MDNGLLRGEEEIYQWCRAVRLLFASEQKETMEATKCDGNMTAFSAAGGVETLMGFMQCYSGTESIAFMSVEAVSLLVTLSPSVHAKLLAAGCLKCLYDAMRAHQASEAVQHAGCVILQRLVSPLPTARAGWACKTMLGINMDGDVKDAVILSGGLRRIYAAMDAHLQSLTVLGEACNALVHLTNGPNDS